MEDPWVDEKSDAYRAIGRYIVEFSRLVFGMRLLLVHSIAGSSTPGGPDAKRAEIALGGATAEPIASAFFAICRYEHPGWDDEERRIADKLERAVMNEIQRRNDYAHGDWFIGRIMPNAPLDDPGLLRTKASRRGSPTTWATIPIAELDRNSDGLFKLRQLVLEFGDVCLALWNLEAARGFRVSDVFEIVGGRKSGTVERRKDTTRPGTIFS